MSLKSRSPLFSFTALLFLGVGIYFVFAYWQKENKRKTLTLNFKGLVGQQPLVFNQPKYPNPGGAGQFKIRDFQFYLSNIKLVGDSGENIEQQSYHLVRFDNVNQSYVIELSNIPKDNYHTIELSIGVDKVANSSITVRGDLDPNSRMAWSWDVGYKFILFEGGILYDGILRPLVYHVGFNENYKPLEFQLDSRIFNQEKPSLDFSVDLLKIFSGTNNINMLELSSIKFDRADAKVLADNYVNMIQMND